MKQPVLTTPRLTLRPFCLDDASTVQALAGNYNVARTTLNIPHPYEDGMAEEWIGSHQGTRQAGTGIAYAITLTSSSQLVGAIGLQDIEGSRGGLGYWIAEPHWGQGYCTEAARALIRFSFDELGLDIIHAEHLESNPASGKVMQKIGMRYVGTACKPDRNNRRSSMALYEILKLEQRPS